MPRMIAPPRRAVYDLIEELRDDGWSVELEEQEDGSLVVYEDDNADGKNRLTPDEWKDRFRPGDLLSLDDPVAAAADEHHVWTLCHRARDVADVIGAGRRRFDAAGYYLCQEAWDYQGMVAVLQIEE